MREIDQAELEQLLQRACGWARQQEEEICSAGISLTQRQTATARQAGVQQPERIRILVVDRVPFPDDEQLARLARAVQIITDASRAVTFGYGIMVRAQNWNDRELLLHQFVHVAQFERVGNLDAVIREFLVQYIACDSFAVGPQEQEARRTASDICTFLKSER